ncbi:ArsC/Spx/MgsR family protein [Bradyrhizobium acaciae]|uniref:ArsC/Spx/MgsR family protein n=1 Tax=Bradyrhizobium acaciae TaxID=2683706 RepID=UPI001E4D1E22|nr:ArsC/Spx/MgsR family protein [Bradyrhizobium acaciae]MCC8978035.1 arsenate reductase family protein [Bradyrhizobium acaciae]
MATVIFFQKPGCATNARQIQALNAAGHNIIAKDILTEPWTSEELRRFFGNAPVVSWFNQAASRIKSGEVNPNMTDAPRALALMLGDPLLIRRPLIDVDGSRCAGFDHELVLTLLDRKTPVDLEGCAHDANETRCPQL